MKKKSKKKQSVYVKAGVDIDVAKETKRLMTQHLHSTYNQYTLSKVGSFGGLFDAEPLKEFENPVLVSSIDGVGTKVMIAEMMNKWTVGQDIVNHCVNDILTLGAKPLFFIDYLATARLKPEIMEKIVENMAITCKAVGIPLITGETAEMPGVYQEGRHDVVGCIVGVVERNKIIDGSKIAERDVLIGLQSNGLHTNGYSLARKAFFETKSYDVNTHLWSSSYSHSLGEELLRIHKCYFKSVYPLIERPEIEIHGIAHITGGGLIDNIARLLPDGLYAEIRDTWGIPTVFQAIQEIEKISNEEMRRVFNLGIGMVLIVPFENIQTFTRVLGQYHKSTVFWLGNIKRARSQKQKREKVVFTY